MSNKRLDGGAELLLLSSIDVGTGGIEQILIRGVRIPVHKGLVAFIDGLGLPLYGALLLGFLVMERKSLLSGILGLL